MNNSHMRPELKMNNMASNDSMYSHSNTNMDNHSYINKQLLTPASAKRLDLGQIVNLPRVRENKSSKSKSSAKKESFMRDSIEVN